MMAVIGFIVFIAFAVAGAAAGMEIYGYGNANGWPTIGTFALASLVSGAMIVLGILANGALGMLAKRR